MAAVARRPGATRGRGEARGGSGAAGGGHGGARAAECARRGALPEKISTRVDATLEVPSSPPSATQGAADRAGAAAGGTGTELTGRSQLGQAERNPKSCRWLCQDAGLECAPMYGARGSSVRWRAPS